MAVTGTVKSTKLVLKLEEGTQTITGCNNAVSDANLYQLGQIVGGLEAHAVENISKVVETTLVEA